MMKIKMIDVLVKQANKEIEHGTILRTLDEKLFGKRATFEFKFIEDNFYHEEGLTLEDLYSFDTDFLNSEVELIPQEAKKYVIKVNVRGLAVSFEYLNYFKPAEGIVLSGGSQGGSYKTHFTKKEMQEIKPVREFLEDMKGKYQLIEVK